MNSSAATERFRQRFGSLDPGHFRPWQESWVSSIGIGTYLGDTDDRTDALYAEALRAALARGCNLIDTAINYRAQRSERVIGRTLAALLSSGELSREELILCTKGGYLPGDEAVPPSLAKPDEIVAGCHCLAPAYLDHALRTSLRNLRVERLDGYYLHNPEQQLDAVSRDTFRRRLAAAFTLLEQRAQEGLIRYYGVATWQGLRANPKARGYLSLEELVQIAGEAGGATHRFRLVQLPYNLAMPEAYAFKNQPVLGEPCSALEAAQRLGLSVIVSASVLQGQLARLPESLAARIPGGTTAAQRAIQFVRSTPGVTAALVGMKTAAHVEENLALAAVPPMSVEAIEAVFDRSRR
jgi:aryl-alcohol dehydrogenase-like predicted oxidoreductase